MAEAQVTTTVLDGDTVLNVVPNDSTQITLNTRDTYMDKNVVINIEGNDKCRLFPITEDIVTVATEATKGVAPYSTSYGYTDITIDEDAGVEWIEGAVYSFVIDTTMVVASATRNVRVRIGEEGDWIPVFGDTAILAGSSYFVKGQSRLFVYKSTYQSGGALHLLTDANTNTTYAYLVNTLHAGGITIDANGFGAKNSLIWPTTPIGSTAPTWSSMVTSSSTAATKTLLTSLTFYADRHPLYIYSADIAAGAASAHTVYQQYQDTDLRYSHNAVASSKCPVGDAVFLYLKDFNSEDYSFKVDSNIFTVGETKLATVFPATGSGDVYLLYMGRIGSSYYQLKPDFAHVVQIYKFDRATGKAYPYNKQNFFTITNSASDLQMGNTTTLASNLFGDNYAPYQPDKSFINYSIKKVGVEWIEGAVYCFALPEGFASGATNTKANGRVRLGTTGTFYPIMKNETTVLNMFTEYVPNRDKFFIFKKTTTTPDGGLYLLPDFVGSALPEGGTTGQVLTKTADGYAWGTVSTEDTKVTQTSTTADGALPILIAKGTTTATDTTYFDTDVTINPGTGAINSVRYELPQQVVICSETLTGGWVWR